jgi:hypothetical protein
LREKPAEGGPTAAAVWAKASLMPERYGDKVG